MNVMCMNSDVKPLGNTCPAISAAECARPLSAAERIAFSIARMGLSSEAELATAIGVPASALAFYRIKEDLPVNFGILVELAALSSHGEAVDPVELARARVNAALTALQEAVRTKAQNQLRYDLDAIYQVRASLGAS